MKRLRGYVPGLFVLLLSYPAFGQGLIAFSGNFGGAPDGGFQGTATFHCAPDVVPEGGQCAVCGPADA